MNIIMVSLAIEQEHFMERLQFIDMQQEMM